MIGLPVEHAGEATAPPADVEAGQAVHQIDADVVEAGLASRHEGGAGAARVVKPTEDGQDRVVERLNTQAHAVDAGASIGAELLSGDAFRVALDRDLDVRGHGKAVTDGVEDHSKLVGLEQRGCAPAEKHRRDLRPSLIERRRSNQTDLDDDAVDITLHARPILERRRVERAVVTPLPAERDVDVKPELSPGRDRIRQRPVW